MIEKVNPMHPDKIADRIAGAIVDIAYIKEKDPKVACEVLIGHGECNIILETSVMFDLNEIKKIVDRITKTNNIKVNLNIQKQDQILASNQKVLSCGDNGIFKGVYNNDEQIELLNISKDIYDKYKTDGKYIYVKNDNKLIICQSNVNDNYINEKYKNYNLILNPLGFWTGGLDVDTGATNRKLGSDMGDAVTGGGLHGKDLSKADVSVNIYCHIKATEIKGEVTTYCAIGDRELNVIFNDGNNIKTSIVKYDEIVEISKKYIDNLGGYEKLAEWGLV